MDNGAQELRLFEHEGGPLIQVEINLEEAPLFMLQKSEQGGEDVIESRSVVVTREGHRMEQYWRVTATRSGGRGRAAFGDESEERSEEMVPGKGGKMVPAVTPVNMTFTVTAKERYLWTLELKRRGLTAVGVLRETMEAMVREDDR